ncbi:MAG: DUF2442 domain-containing protein [Clostridia bacterium]|nr:DUF2442 domain-containing protein [Clostridia bacterium]
MFVKDGIAYASEIENGIKVISVKVVGELSLLVVFSTGEERIFDMLYLMKYPVYEKLKDYEYFKSVTIENGVLVWGDGELDIAPEEVYKESYEYEKIIAQ